MKNTETVYNVIDRIIFDAIENELLDFVDDSDSKELKFNYKSNPTTDDFTPAVLNEKLVKAGVPENDLNIREFTGRFFSVSILQNNQVQCTLYSRGYVPEKECGAGF